MISKQKKYLIVGVGSLLLLIAVGYIGFLYGREKMMSEQKDKQSDAVVKVKTAPARQAAINKIIKAYGNVIAPADKLRSVSVPFESKICRVKIIEGQAVSSGMPLIELEAGPESLLQLEEAKSALDKTVKELALTKQRLELKLATNVELIEAENALQLAQLQLKSLENRGVGNVCIKSDVNGLVNKLEVRPGQVLAAGSPLLELIDGNQVEVKFGVEPHDANGVKSGMTVWINNIANEKPNGVQGKIRLIANTINPATRLIDVFVSLPDKNPFLLNTYVYGKIVIASKKALVVPRSSVLLEDEKRIVFTIADGKAVKHEVTIGLEDGSNVEIIGEQIKENEPVVIEGNYELENGMGISVENDL